MGRFDIEVNAYNFDGDQVGTTFRKTAKDATETTHVVTILPEFEFGTGDDIYRIEYRYRAREDNSIEAGPYELIFFEKN